MENVTEDSNKQIRFELELDMEVSLQNVCLRPELNAVKCLLEKSSRQKIIIL